MYKKGIYQDKSCKWLYVAEDGGQHSGHFSNFKMCLEYEGKYRFTFSEDILVVPKEML